MTERLFYCETATIQSVMKFIAEQHNNGTVWARDEILGLFKSIGQFSSKDSEGLECVLKFWDGSGIKVDRVNKKDCFMTLSTCLNIVGGIQPGVFTKLYKDSEDSQGLGARFLHAVPKPVEPEFTFGHCLLAELLPNLYRQLDNIPKGNVKLSPDSMKLYKVLYKKFMKEARLEKNPALRAWKKKACSHILRIALGLHLIEWCFDNTRPLWELQTDTLEKALEFTIYYRNSLHLIHAKTSSDDDMGATLFKIWDLAVASVDGITPRDAYRAIRAITTQAKNCGRAVVDYTRTLFLKLVEDGKGTIEKNGRNIKFIVKFINPNGDQSAPAPNPPGSPFNPIIPRPDDSNNHGGNRTDTHTGTNPLIHEDVASLTRAESQVIQDFFVSREQCQATCAPPNMDKVAPLQREPIDDAENFDIRYSQPEPLTRAQADVTIKPPGNLENIFDLEKPIPQGQSRLEQHQTIIDDPKIAKEENSKPQVVGDKTASNGSESLIQEHSTIKSPSLTPSSAFPNQIPSPGGMSTRVEVVTRSVAFELHVGDRLTLLVENKYQNSFKFMSCQGDGSLLFENETISKQEKLTQKEVEERFLEFIASSTGSSTPRPLPQSEDVRDLAAMFTNSVKKGKETIEEIFELLYTEYIHLARRVWQSLSNTVKGLVAEIAPDVHYCLEDFKS